MLLTASASQPSQLSHTTSRISIPSIRPFPTFCRTAIDTAPSYLDPKGVPVPVTWAVKRHRNSCTSNLMNFYNLCFLQGTHRQFSSEQKIPNLRHAVSQLQVGLPRASFASIHGRDETLPTRKEPSRPHCFCFDYSMQESYGLSIRLFPP